MTNNESELIVLYRGAREGLKELRHRYYAATNLKEISEINEEIKLHLTKVREAKAKLRAYRELDREKQKSPCFYHIGIMVGKAMRVVSNIFWIFPPKDKDDNDDSI